MPFFIVGPLEPNLYTSIGFRDIQRDTMVDMTLIRPLNKGHGHSFWYINQFLIYDFL